MDTTSGVVVLSVTELPRKLSSFPNHVEWINELVKFVQGAALKDVTSAEEYVKRRLTKGDDDEVTTEGQGETRLDKLKRVAKTMNRAAMSIYVQVDVKAAQEQLEELRKTVATQVPPRLLETTEYLIDSLRCASAIMKSEGGNLEEEYVRLYEKWKDLQSSNLTQAAISFFKSRLSRQLSVKEDKTLEYCLEATRLSPKCYLWYHGAYRTKRRLRRGIERGFNPLDLKPPSPEEEGLAAKAYQLCPTDLIAITDYALVLKEKLQTTGRQHLKSPRNKETHKKAKQLFREALQVAKTSGNKQWEVNVTVYLAEFLAFGPGDKFDKEEGRHLLEELAENHPPNSMVLHKLGKVYYKGVGGGRNRARTLACYEEAIELCPINFGCIMDYLKLLEAKTQFMEMVRVCDKALEHCRRDGDKVKLTARRTEALRMAIMNQDRN